MFDMKCIYKTGDECEVNRPKCKGGEHVACKALVSKICFISIHCANIFAIIYNIIIFAEAEETTIWWW